MGAGGEVGIAHRQRLTGVDHSDDVMALVDDLRYLVFVGRRVNSPVAVIFGCSNDSGEILSSFVNDDRIRETSCMWSEMSFSAYPYPIPLRVFA